MVVPSSSPSSPDRPHPAPTRPSGTTPGAPYDTVEVRAKARAAAELVVGFLAYCLISLVYWRPIRSFWRQRIAPDPGDPLFNLAVLDWVKEQIRLGLPDLYGAGFFHPLAEPLLLSDHLLGLAAQALALDTLTGGNSIATYNLLVFLAFPLSGIAAGAVCRAAGLSRLGAFTAGAVYAFAPYHWSQLSHLQVLTYQWIPPALWFFDRLLVAPRARTATLFLLFYALVVTGGNYLAFMVHVPLAILLVHRGVSAPGWRALLAKRNLPVLAATGLVAGGLTVALFLPYALAAERLGLSRNPANFQQFGATLVSLLTPSRHNLHFDLMKPLLSALGAGYEGESWLAEKSLFLGFVASVLLVVGLRHRAHGLPPRTSPRTAAFAGLLALALFLVADLYSLGQWPARPSAALADPGRVYTVLGVPLLLALALLIWSRRGRPEAGRPAARTAEGATWERGLLLAGGVSILLCFPVFYEPLAHVVPGFSGMRVPTRFFPFALFSAASLAGRGLDELVSATGAPRRARAVGAAVLLLLLVELAPRPIPWHPVPRTDPPAVTLWLQSADEVEALLHLPLAEEPTGEIARMDLATIHRRPIVNGFSGHFPEHWQELRRICCWPVPDDRGLATLRSWGVTHLVIHPRWQRRWQQREARAWAGEVANGDVPGVVKVWEDPATGDTVFRIDAETAGAPTDR